MSSTLPPIDPRESQRSEPAGRLPEQLSLPPLPPPQPPSAAPPTTPPARPVSTPIHAAPPTQAGPKPTVPAAVPLRAEPSKLVVPPPPPPRATLPPVRPETVKPARFTGARADAAMGSAQQVGRWKGEVAGLEPTGSSSDSSEANVALSDQLVKSVPSWLVSMVLHLMLLVLLALFAGPVGPNFGKIMLTIGQSEGVPDAELNEFSIDQQSLSVEDAEMEELEVPVDLSLPELTAIAPEIPTQSLSPVAVESGLGEVGVPAAPMVGGRTGSMKKTLLALYGGTPVTESAVASGLEWLVRNQNKDGSWSLRGPYDDGGSTENKPAATAMAMLAFLGAGNTHSAGEYKDVVLKAAQWLVKQQDRDGFFAKNARDHQQAYAQAQCSIAICELYAMTHDSWLRSYAQKAIDCAEEWQAEEGGWRYQPRFDSDTSVTGWFVMTLQSGLSGGLEVDRAVLYKVHDFLDSVQSYEGAGYAYQRRGGPSQAMTAEGLLCRQYLGWPRNHPALVRGIEALSSDYNFDISDTDYYYWYYATQVLHHFGGEPWDAWNREMREELPRVQIKSGREKGSWPPQADRWGGTGGRLYTTCMAIYCLEVYYRHMPIYKTDIDDEALPGAEQALEVQ